MDPVSPEYMREFLSLYFVSGHAILVNALSGGIALLFVTWFLKLRINPRSRRTLRAVRLHIHEDPRPRWMKELIRDVYAAFLNLQRHALPDVLHDEPDYADTLTEAQRRGAAQLDPTVSVIGQSRKQRAEEQLRWLWDKMIRRQCCLWADNFEQHRYGVNPGRVDLSFNGTVYSVLMTEELEPFPHLPSLGCAIDNISAVTATIFRLVPKLLGLCNDTVQACLRVEDVRVPLDVRRYNVRSLQWLPLLMTPSSIGSIPGLLDFVHTALDFQSHTYHQLPCLVDIKPFYSVMKRVYSRSFTQYNVASRIQNTPLLFGIWHAYKYCAIVMYRAYLPILALLEKPSIRTDDEPQFRTKPKLRHMEVVFACLLLHANRLREPLVKALQQATPNTQGHKILTALKTLLLEHVPALFAIGILTRDCTWHGRQNGTGGYYRDGLFYSFILLLSLTGECAYKVEYVRGIAISLLLTSTWHARQPGSIYQEETCEALLGRLAKLIHRYPTHTSSDALMDLFLTTKPGSRGYKDIRKSCIPPSVLRSIGDQLTVLINVCCRDSQPFARWTGSDHFTNVEPRWDMRYSFPLSLTTVTTDESWVHDVLTRSLMVLASATSTADQHLGLMDNLFARADPGTIAERSTHHLRLKRIGLPARFKKERENDVLPPALIVEADAFDNDSDSDSDSDA